MKILWDYIYSTVIFFLLIADTSDGTCHRSKKTRKRREILKNDGQYDEYKNNYR